MTSTIGRWGWGAWLLAAGVLVALWSAVGAVVIATLRKGRREVLLAAGLTVGLTAMSLVAIRMVRDGPLARPRGVPVCNVPTLPGTAVHVTLANMGGSMMGGGSMMAGSSMRLYTDRSTIDHDTVTFVAANVGTVDHELLVLPLPGGQAAGHRAVGDKARIDETGNLGEASASCAAGSGEGIVVGSSGWLTLDLAPGSYELLCNLPGHYTSGMYAQLTVT